MTINQLYNQLEKLIKKGIASKRMLVCIDKSSFQSNLEVDGVCIFPVDFAEVRVVNLADDDGGIAFNRDGTEKQRTELVLFGESGQKGQW